MNAVTQLVLYTLYLICALAIWLLLPGFVELETATLVGISLFFLVIALALHNFILTWRQSFARDHQMEKLQTVVQNLRHDLERSKRQVTQIQSAQAQRGASNREVVAELKVLQTLLDQVVSGDADDDEAMQEVAEQAGQAVERAEQAREGDDDEQLPDLDQVKPERDRGPDLPADKDTQRLMDVIQSGLSENRVDLYLQPIVALPGRNKVHYECFSRVRDSGGNVLEPRDFLPLAEKGGLVGTLDNLLLFRLIQLVRRLGSRQPDVRFFINLSNHSLNDKEFFPQFVEFMQSNREFSRRMVFEVSQADWDKVDEKVKGLLANLGKEGFTFSLDQVTNTDLDAKALGESYFRWVKVDQKQLFEDFGENDVDVLRHSLRQQGMSLIASHVELDSEDKRVGDARLEFAQGYLFAPPRAANELADEL